MAHHRLSTSACWTRASAAVLKAHGDAVLTGHPWCAVPEESARAPRLHMNSPLVGTESFAASATAVAGLAIAQCAGLAPDL